MRSCVVWSSSASLGDHARHSVGSLRRVPSPLQGTSASTRSKDCPNASNGSPCAAPTVSAQQGLATFRTRPARNSLHLFASNSLATTSPLGYDAPSAAGTAGGGDLVVSGVVAAFSTANFTAAAAAAAAAAVFVEAEREPTLEDPPSAAGKRQRGSTSSSSPASVETSSVRQCRRCMRSRTCVVLLPGAAHKSTTQCHGSKPHKSAGSMDTDS
mmetsp:Transcript_67888/g.133185  ORF Transcript_67888/g.133185 Transcript_67888/m.133185 type:complete len:213 (-) Transcript_67888:504-1142(-)